MMMFGIGSSIIILLIVIGVLNLNTIMSFWILFGVLLITGIIIFSLSMPGSVAILLTILRTVLCSNCPIIYKVFVLWMYF